MIISLYPTGRIVMCLGGSEVWNWWVMSSLHHRIVVRIKLDYICYYFFYHHKSLKLMTRVLLHQPLFHNALLALTFTIQKYWPAWSFSLHILKYPFPNPLFLLPSAHQTSNTDITSSQEFSRNYFSLFAPTPIIPCACEYPCTFQVVLWLSIYSPVLSTGLWDLLKGRNCPSWLQWVPILNHMPHVFRTK